MAMTPFKNKHKFKLTSFQTIIFGFLGAIGTGALLLMLPFATVSGHHASFHDAVFTATSATCVTGLVVQDTGTYWSMFGQFVILLLIQIGGMGVITIAAECNERSVVRQECRWYRPTDFVHRQVYISHRTCRGTAVIPRILSGVRRCTRSMVCHFPFGICLL